jgi:hypothetical protein
MQLIDFTLEGSWKNTLTKLLITIFWFILIVG